MNYILRECCIFCNSKLTSLFFENDLQIPLSCYLVDKHEKTQFIPYNIFTCSTCKTIQTKYLGDLNLIYKFNHADSTGNIMKNLHINVLELLKKYISSITNIIEIGSSYGILSNLILNNCNKVNKYYIIEPSYFGNKTEKQIIIKNFFENVKEYECSDANTLIISHVFEHFYNPIEILEKIRNMNNIENFLLVWPDLECYKDNNTYHVLNTEHTFYVDNNFIEILLNNYSFELIEKKYYEKHSVIFLFKRSTNLPSKKLENINYSIDNYFNNLFKEKEYINDFIKKNKNNGKKICIWPASVHTQFLLMCLNLNNSQIDYVLDNSINKIGKYMYGYNLECKSFEENKSNNDYAIILNGGCFNKEVFHIIEINKEQLIIL
jgi:hypothetical protein